MFSLIAGTVESLTPVGRRERIVFLGLDGAGKSFLIQNLILLSQKQEICVEIGKTHPTLGLNVSQLASPNNNISLLEVGGSPSIRPMWRHYYDDATKFVFILDSSNIDRYDEAYQEFSDFKGTRFLDMLTFLLKEIHKVSLAETMFYHTISCKILQRVRDPSNYLLFWSSIRWIFGVLTMEERLTSVWGHFSRIVAKMTLVNCLVSLFLILNHLVSIRS